jgi:hypothetical protein
MARIIGNERKHTESSYSLARMEDVDIDNLKRKYMENIKNGSLPSDERTVTEIQASEDAVKLTEFADFFELEGVDVDPMTDNPLDAMVQISNMMEEGAQELDIVVQTQRENAIEENAAEGIEQIKEFAVNDGDPLLASDFKEKSERIIQKLVVEDKKKTESSTSSVFEEARRESRSSSANDDIFNTKTSGIRTTTATATTTTQSASGNQQRDKEIHAMYADGSNAMRAFVYNGPVKPKKKKESKAHHFGGRKRFSFKNMVSTVKKWLHSEEASTLCKVGIAVCLETALAVITKQRSFDGAGQTFGYIGMMLGVFYIGSELRSIGYDQRRLAMI